MNVKIERVSKEIEKTKEKINEQQARLRELEKQKTELENLDIVSTVRGMNISLADLGELLKHVRQTAPATSGQVDPKLDETEPTPEPSQTITQEPTHKEDNE